MSKFWKRVGAFALAGAMLLALTGCGDKSVSGTDGGRQGRSEDELTIASGKEPEEGFSPITGWGSYQHPLFFSTLLWRDGEMKIVKDLAADYTVSEDGLTYRFTLREDAVFSDGEPLEASDVVFTFEKAAEGTSVDLTNLADAAAQGNEVVLTLKAPQSTFIDTVCRLGIVPEHAYGEDFAEHPVGSGPYKLVQWDKGQQVIAEYNDLYYGSEPFFKKLTFVFLSEETTFAAAKAGELDVAAVTNAMGGESVAGMEMLDLSTIDNRGIVFPVNEPSADGTVGNAVTSDRAVRQAVNLAVDRETLIDGVLYGFGKPAYTECDGMPWWNEETAIEDGDLEGAARLLEEAGWIPGEDGVRVKDGLRCAFTLIYPSGDQVRESLSLAMADMLLPAGMEVTVEGVSWDELGTRMLKDPSMQGWGSHSAMECYNLYHTTADASNWYNVGYYSNAAVDRYLEEALYATDTDAADEGIRKAQWDGETGYSLLGDAAWAWLVNIDHVYFVSEGLDTGVQKLHPHGHGWPITDNITEWKWK